MSQPEIKIESSQPEIKNEDVQSKKRPRDEDTVITRKRVGYFSMLKEDKEDKAECGHTKVYSFAGKTEAGVVITWEEVQEAIETFGGMPYNRKLKWLEGDSSDYLNAAKLYLDNGGFGLGSEFNHSFWVHFCEAMRQYRKWIKAEEKWAKHAEETRALSKEYACFFEMGFHISRDVNDSLKKVQEK